MAATGYNSSKNKPSMIAYLVTNSRNQKSYIGITTRSLDRRWYEHCYVENSCAKLLSKAIKKYGIDVFEIKEIASSIDDLDGLKKLETMLIEQYQTLVPNGYNLTKGGDGVWGFKQDPKIIEQIASKKRGTKLSNETKQKMRESHLGQKNHFYGQQHTKESKQKISESKKGCAGPWTGKSRDEDTKKKVSESLKAYWALKRQHLNLGV